MGAYAVAPAIPCAVCHDGEAQGFGERAPSGDLVCSWECEARARADHAVNPLDAMQAIADLADLVDLVTVRVTRNGGGSVWIGHVIDWRRDGTELVCEAEVRDGYTTERRVRFDNCRRIEVVDG